MNNMTTKLFIFCICALFNVFLPASFASAAPASDQDARPVKITADLMEADDAQKIVTFTGNVVARQKDIVLTCDIMRVFYEDDQSDVAAGSSAPAIPAAAEEQSSNENANAESDNSLVNENSQIVKIECEGNVKITQQDKIALGEKAVYLAREKPRKIILTGDPRLWRNRDYLTGKRIIYFVDENRSIVESGGKAERVNAVFYQNSKGGEKTADQENTQ